MLKQFLYNTRQTTNKQTNKRLQTLFTLQTSHASVQVVRLPGDQYFSALSSSYQNIYLCNERQPEVILSLVVVTVIKCLILVHGMMEQSSQTPINVQLCLQCLGWTVVHWYHLLQYVILNSSLIISVNLLVSMLTCLIDGEVTSIITAACIMPERDIA